MVSEYMNMDEVAAIFSVQVDQRPLKRDAVCCAQINEYLKGSQILKLEKTSERRPICLGTNFPLR